MTTSTKPSTSTRDAGAAPVAAYVREQISAIRGGDAALRRGEDPIHATRVAIRRLRSTVRVFGGAFDPAVATGLDEELSWYAGILGHVRDQGTGRSFRRITAVDPTPRPSTYFARWSREQMTWSPCPYQIRCSAPVSGPRRN
ncbi:CHAD domain-containing protein [Rhodococcus sp. KRD197]|uniref:CHAD domain-containing protein n=1 Tax=Rhodococcus sp. KRD197 TaxID=2729731 RepID=UPI0019CFA998|nr:CHAD domain-containing protein [Rhodococcus sp. KRD197]